MNEKDIRKYAGLMEELGLTGLEITDDVGTVRLERNPATVSAAREAVSVSNVSVPEVKPSTDDGAEYYTVKSDMVGVFYAAPTENAEPFVRLGDRVELGKTLCIIEAMKLMNEISCEVDGTVAEIFVTNGQVVEYGTPLFRIKR